MRKVYLILAIMLVLVGVIVFFALSLNGGTATKTIKDPTAINKTVAAFVGNPYKDEYDLSRIAGYIDNRGAAKVVRAHLEIQLVDKDGNRKELVKYDVTDIPAFSRRTFDANAGDLPAGSRRAQAKITEVEVVK